VAAPLPVVLVETVNGQAIRYVYGNDLLALVDPASTILFYHFDGSDSTTGLTDVTGTSVESYHYASFGSLRMRTGDSEQNMLFSGEQDDEEVNLLFLRARYYDSDAGRFISRDVFPVRTYQTQGISRYIYTQNNPIRFSDTSGLDRKENESFVINWVYAGGFRQSGESYRIVNNFLEVFNPLYNMAAKEYIFRFAKTRPIDTSLRPYIWGRAWLDQVNTVGDYITLGTHIMDSADRFQAGEVDSLEVGAGEFSAVAANTLNDIITGPGRSIAKLAVGKDVVSGIPVISQLDQDITGQQVVENIEGFMEMGPSKYFGCVWDVLSGRQCR
ncbi:MAG: RHS repeat-associated core domain-containing protein, partial [Caldilineaceae bacterium]|nr:RHS repeat-associated core domain-containing protein [Caldilineaceae bacterium]